MQVQMEPFPLIPPPSGETKAPRAGLVMVVDDEEHNRTLLRDSLEARGYRVVEAENGITALRKVEEQTPDVILLDIMMPKMDGFDVCRRLKKYWKSAHVPILVLTALSDRQDRLMAIEAGANDFLTKPLDVQDVIMRVGNALYAKRLHDQLQTERERSDRLLRDILPKPIADRMRNGEVNIAQSHSDVSVLVADVVGFTTLTSNIDPVQIVNLLNEIFSSFDMLVEERGLEKIKVVGDAYMVAGGIYTHESDHAEIMAELALAFHEDMQQINELYNTSIQIRIGINTGPLVAGVIGRNTFAYDIWGETVSNASQLEANSEPGRILVGESTYHRLKNKYKFEAQLAEDSEGYGALPAYWLVM